MQSPRRLKADPTWGPQCLLPTTPMQPDDQPATLAAQLHAREAERLAALDSYAILDTAPEQDFDDIAALASEICGTPIAVVNLIGDGRQWFKAEVGLGVRETPLDTSFCRHAILETDFLLVPDATKDPRFECNPLVTAASGLRFYAGALIKSPEGLPLGTLCVLDTRPRDLTDQQARALKRLARQVMAQMELRRALDAQDKSAAHLRALNSDLELRVAERTLARSRTWKLSPEIMGVLNGDGYFEQSNPAWQAVLGWSETEIASTVFFDFIHPDDLAKTRSAWADAMERGVPALQFENRYRTKVGGWRWLSWVAMPDHGKVYCSARDITDEKRLAADLAARTAERDRLWETTNDLMGTAGLDGFLKGVNPAWTRMLGWSEAEVLGRPFFDIVDPADHAATVEVVQRLAVGETVTGFVDHVLSKDGSWRTVMWTAVPEPGSNIFYIVGRDLTEQHRTEEALRQSQKMEAVGQLTGGLAHDFNNLLAGISGSLELMQTRMQQGRLNDVDRYMAAAQGAAKRAAALTHRLLAFSRRQTLAPKPTNVNALVAGMEELIRRTVGPSVHFEVVGASGLWPALVDPPQLENALLNLCINARDAMPDGGRITVETANKWLDRYAARQHEVPEGQYLSLCVTDTGTGMSPEVIERVFEPFFTTKPIGEGTGLGLSMIYGFAKQSGGQVRIYSEVGEGTTVCLYLPRHHGETAEDVELATVLAIPRAERGETVLIVDDEPTVRMLVTDVLEDLGYTAIEAADSAAGLKVLRSDVQIDLLITDVGLPGGLNGRQMADAGRESRPDLKVLFITGYAENAVLGNGHLSPGMAVLTKPFAVDALGARIREMIMAKSA